jgi:hypothetical protein
MANSVRVKISNAQDYAPHAELLADDAALGLLLDALTDLDPCRTVASKERLQNTIQDVKKAREALKVVA